MLKHFDRIEDVVVKGYSKRLSINDAKIHLHKSLHDNEDEAMLAAFYDDSKQSTLNINQPLCIKEGEIRWVNLKRIYEVRQTVLG